jgi:hypothetical protein
MFPQKANGKTRCGLPINNELRFGIQGKGGGLCMIWRACSACIHFLRAFPW